MLMTANPCADAERWANEQDSLAAQAEALEIEAGRIVLAELQGLTPTRWGQDFVSGPRYFSPDELLFNALEVDDEMRSAFAVLMTSPAAQQVRELMAHHQAKTYWRDIAGYPDAV